MSDADVWPCYCRGEHSEWGYHSEGGCAATAQAFAFVRDGAVIMLGGDADE